MTFYPMIGEAFLINLAIAVVLSLISGYIMSRKKTKLGPLSDDAQVSHSTRGNYCPYALGVTSVIPIIGWVGNRGKKAITTSGGGKGVFGTGPVSQTYHTEYGFLPLCTGPIDAILRIWEQGKVVWIGEVERPANGAPVEIDIDAHNSVWVYWGTEDQPVNEELANWLGVSSSYPNLAYLWFQPKLMTLGDTWGQLKVEVRVKPEQSPLTGSPNWIYREEDPSVITYDLKRSNGGAPGANYFIVQNDRTRPSPAGAEQKPHFIVQSNATISGMTGSSAQWNGDYQVIDLSYDDTLADIDLTGDRDFFNFGNITNFTTVSVPGPYTSLNVSATYFSSNAGGSGYFERMGRFVDFLPYANQGQQASFIIRSAETSPASGLWIDSAVWVEMYNRTDSARRASVEISFVSGVASITDTYGVTSASVSALQNGWYLVVVDVYTGDGISAPHGEDLRELMIRFEGVGHVYFYNEEIWALSESEGTRVFLDHTFSSSVSNSGRLTPWVVNGWDGANPIHAIAQMLFADPPHGLGLDLDDFFDREALEAAASSVGVGGERIPASFRAEGGMTAKDALEGIMLDLGLMLPIDVKTGLVKAALLREPENVVSVPEDAVLPPLPEITTSHDEPVHNRVVFSLRDRQSNYREVTVALGDDGSMSLLELADAKISPMFSITDLITAASIAERRQLEELVPVTTVKITMGRNARLLVPGTAISATSEVDETLRVTGLSVDPAKRGVTAECLVDAYGVPVAQIPLEQGSPPPGGSLTPSPDPMFRFWEPTRFLSTTKARPLVLRARASRRVSAAVVWFSLDGSSYSSRGSQTTEHAAGVLEESLSSSSRWYLEEGPVVDLVGPPDLDAILDLSGDEASWRGGKQLCLLVDSSGNEEICFLQSVTALSSSRIRLDGLLRARYDTDRLDLAAGDSVFIFINSSPSYEDPLLAPGQTLYLKTQPLAANFTPLDEVTAFSKELVGRWVTPMRPCALRVSSLPPVYSSGGDIELRWNYRSSLGLAYRTGAGFQGAGEATGVQNPDGTFELVVTDPNYPLAPLSTIVEIPAALTYTLTNSWVTSTFGYEPTELQFSLRGVEAGRYSDPVTLTVYHEAPETLHGHADLDLQASGALEGNGALAGSAGVDLQGSGDLWVESGFSKGFDLGFS